MILGSTLPWLLPGLVATVAVTLVVHRRVAAALGVSRTSAAAILLCGGVILSGTLTPFRGPLDGGAVGTGLCDATRTTLPSLDELVAVTRNDTLLNVLMFIPLGFVVGSARRGRRTAALALAVLTLPILIETTQLVAPVLARSCQTADVVDNLSGLVLGLVLGLVAGVLRGTVSR